MENNVIAPHQQIKANHPETGKPIIIVGVDTSGSSLDPKLVDIRRGPKGI